MNQALPICCNPQAYRLLESQVASLGSSDALLNGAVAIASHQLRDVDLASVDQAIQEHANKIRSRVRSSRRHVLVAHLHEYLFEELAFVGNRDDYYNAVNSYLPAVLETKRGLPISLCLVYKLIAERLGLRVNGVGLPGHFVVSVHTDGEPMLIDCFEGGRLLSREEAHQKVMDIHGPDTEWDDELLRPVSNRHWLTRMLQNLLNVFGARSQYTDVAAILEMEMLLWPDQNQLQRDLGLVLARCGMPGPASQWLDAYLENNPDDPQREDLLQLRNVLTA
ncbi:SirB1 family protein [Humisphaera borealis]|uniref:Transglutaminase family protein n=1 Tax=Humisphaera borealis TaxID=2807512 RepID=A0A7M2X2W6_9BACT|nr:transglutaminase-like domain-containing protein [Humisphaera borealis]QOV92025.1 transglutaminase family protein [Humisphaera borealis]